MATLRDIKRRIRSVRSTQQITKAMEMVAAAKLRRAQSRVLAARPYARAMDVVLENLSATAAEVGHPLFTPRPVKKRLVVVLGADRGLCGSYNAGLFRATESFLRSEDGRGSQLFLIGRKARDYFRRRRYDVLDVMTDLPADALLESAKNLSERLQKAFLSGEVDAVDLEYTQFVSVMSRRVVREPFLPIRPREAKSGTARNYIFEPDAESLLAELLPRYATTKLLQALAEAAASEHAARMVAMSSARKNAGELIDALVLRRNRLRQAIITKEIAEIVGGAEALV
ncbi:MAG TPA: ATP synthase F1 subunit gamma [Candidatus Eisenbacteria bacterium]|nr:ATP synthase F1 subunit gamma [Candidatus Eisenbacteria bacterium]